MSITLGRVLKVVGIAWLAAGAAWSGAAALRAQVKVQRAQTHLDANKEPYVNLSELHFGYGKRGIPVSDEPMPAEIALPAISRSKGLVPLASHAGARRNSEARRKVADQRLALGARQGSLSTLGLDFPRPGGLAPLSGSWEGGFVCTEPDIVIPDSGCCSYWYKDQVANENTVYRQPYHAFKDSNPEVAEQNARKFAATVRASMPLFLPYKNQEVRPASGWLYAPGRFHGAIDYTKTKYESGQDPSFKVYSVGDGTVVTVLWDDWSGNIVIIEHKAPNGDRYRSAYMHLRNGFDHDLAKARAIVVPKDKEYDKDGNPTNLLKYKKYSNKAKPSQLQWGTNAQKIAVKPGDKVYAGQFIAYSGNTGPGGAGNGLNGEGNPKNPVTANNHLHLMMVAPNPTPGSKEWVQVDPYGVYNTAATNCYDLLDDTAYARLFAPFYPSFHNVPTAVLAKYFSYFPEMGYGLQTLSLHRTGGKVLASGSFQYALPPQWYARFYMTGPDYQYWFNEYDKKGFRPREISVTTDQGGSPRFTAIWKKRGNESYSAVHGLTNTDWKTKWDQLVVKGKMRVEDHVSYNVDGNPRHAAIFVGDGDTAFYEWHHMSSNEFQTKFDQYSKEGFRLVSVNAAELDGGLLWGGVWRKLSGQWIAHHGLTPAEYQQKFDEYGPKGLRLHKVQGYKEPGRFAAIWTKP